MRRVLNIKSYQKQKCGFCGGLGVTVVASLLELKDKRCLVNYKCCSCGASLDRPIAHIPTEQLVDLMITEKKLCLLKSTLTTQ